MALDGSTNGPQVGVFKDIDRNQEEWIDIPIIKGRGIVVAKGIERVIATESCMAVCCKELGVYLMRARQQMHM